MVPLRPSQIQQPLPTGEGDREAVERVAEGGLILFAQTNRRRQDLSPCLNQIPQSPPRIRRTRRRHLSHRQPLPRQQRLIVSLEALKRLPAIAENGINLWPSFQKRRKIIPALVMDCGIETPFAPARRDRVPERDLVIEQHREPLGVLRRRHIATREDLRHHGPESVLRMRIILLLL